MKLLPHHLRQSIISRFPKCERSYEFINHKKVHFNTIDCIQYIPKGEKYYLWFKKYNNMYYSYLISQDKKKVFSIHLSFHKELTCGPNGTLVYGTFDNYKIFYVEQIYLFKNIYNKSLRVDQYVEFMNSIRRTKHDPIFIRLSRFENTPDTMKSLLTSIQDIQYPLYAVRCYHKNNKTSLVKVTPKMSAVSNTSDEIFMLKAKITSDVYEAFIMNQGSYSSIGHVLIPSYKTSVMLNRVFRNIKENDDIDCVEMSDDEEEFENISDDKYVDTELMKPYVCRYNRKFKKWIPLEEQTSSKEHSMRPVTDSITMAKKYKLYI